MSKNQVVLKISIKNESKKIKTEYSILEIKEHIRNKNNNELLPLF